MKATMNRTQKERLLLYGAYGFTGRLAAEIAAARKLDMVLAGRNKDALAEMGDRLSLPTRAVGLNDAGELSEALRDIACVVHMAGPFAATSAPMLNACLATQTNYVDITGEIEVFEAMWSREAEIMRAGITAVLGAGFDVVPTDCLAGYVASKVEQPAWLVMALRGLQSASQGTLRTAIRQVSKPVLCRRAGAIVALKDRSPLGIDFGSGDEPCVPVSWGDVATAFHSTGVGNITVYFRRTKFFRSADILGRLFGPLLRSPMGQKGLAAIVRRFPEGPNQAERSGHRVHDLGGGDWLCGKVFQGNFNYPRCLRLLCKQRPGNLVQNHFAARSTWPSYSFPGIRCGFCVESTGMLSCGHSAFGK
jgi:short subunit dehydrogenase-like uncharacterized protein